MSHTASQDLTSRLAQLQSDPERTIVVLPTPALPSARLLHTLRYYIERYGLDIEVMIEDEILALLQTAPDLLAGRLVRLPASNFVNGTPVQTFADRAGLLDQLHAAGAWIHQLPRVDNWSFVTDQLQFLAYLERGVIMPPPGWEAFAEPQQGTAAARPGIREQAQIWRQALPTIPASEVKPWH